MGRRRRKVLREVAFDIYRELYANATPSANFDELFEHAEIVDGKRIIPYEDYEIEEEILMGIMNKHLIANKLKKHEKDAIKFEVLLGVSPKTKIT